MRDSLKWDKVRVQLFRRYSFCCPKHTDNFFFLNSSASVTALPGFCTRWAKGHTNNKRLHTLNTRYPLYWRREWHVVKIVCDLTNKRLYHSTYIPGVWIEFLQGAWDPVFSTFWMFSFLVILILSKLVLGGNLEKNNHQKFCLDEANWHPWGSSKKFKTHEFIEQSLVTWSNSK